jgi:hypothetical protein
MHCASSGAKHNVAARRKDSGKNNGGDGRRYPRWSGDSREDGEYACPYIARQCVVNCTDMLQIAVGTYHILANPNIHSRFLAELRTLIPTSSSPLPSASQLSRLPYLTATVHESTRIANGVTGRLVRISPEKDILYTASTSTTNTTTASSDPVVIFRGVTFSMSHYIQHTNTSICPEPSSFSPGRYIGELTREEDFEVSCPLWKRT